MNNYRKYGAIRYWMIIMWLLLGLASLSLTSCSYVKKAEGNPAYDSISTILKQGADADARRARQVGPALPTDVEEAMMPRLDSQAGKLPAQSEKRFDISVQDVPAATFFAGLVKNTKYNIMVSPKVKGNITLNLKQVTIEGVLNAVRDNYGYQYRRTPYGFQILPNDLETRIFNINYLDINRRGHSKTTINSGQITQKYQDKGTNNASSAVRELSSGKKNSVLNSSSIETSSQINFWAELKRTLNTIVGDKDGRKVMVNPEAGVVVVHATHKELKQVAQYLDTLQNIMTRQVILEAKVLEVQLNNDFQSGVDWNVLGLRQTSTGENNDLGTNLQGIFPSIFTLDAHSGNNFTAVIKLLSSQGNVQVLSSPHISTLNNTQAVIKVGQDEFFITNVSTTTIASTTSETKQDVELTPFFSGIALDVTPQISSHDEVILHIHPIISTVKDQEKNFTVNNEKQQLPLALSKIRESDNIVRAGNGQMVVIGGLMTNTTEEDVAKVPVLGNAPVVGPLFRRTNQHAVKSELIILLRPIVVKPKTWTTQMTEASKRYGKLDRGFHYGTHPEVFGNEAEKRD